MNQPVERMRRIGGMTYVVFGIAMFLVSCQDGKEGGEKKKDEISDEVEEPQVDTKEEFPIDEYCSYLMDDRPTLIEARDYVTEWQESHRQLSNEEYRDVLLSSCYKSRFLMDPATDICDCINEYGQASLECDHIHEKIHANYSKMEEEAIEDVFIELNCLDE